MKVGFVVYVSATGAVVRSGRCEESIVGAQAINDGEAVIEAEMPVSGSYEVQDGELVEA